MVFYVNLCYCVGIKSKVFHLALSAFLTMLHCLNQGLALWHCFWWMEIQLVQRMRLSVPKGRFHPSLYRITLKLNFAFSLSKQMTLNFGCIVLDWLGKKIIVIHAVFIEKHAQATDNRIPYFLQLITFTHIVITDVKQDLLSVFEQALT